jgi:hypothetical protein
MENPVYDEKHRQAGSYIQSIHPMQSGIHNPRICPVKALEAYLMSLRTHHGDVETLLLSFKPLTTARQTNSLV